MIDKIIQNYKILSIIGEGGMGTVYLAEDIMLDKQVAIKALNPLLSTDSQFLQRFRQEAKLQASLDHGNIVRIYSLLKEEDRFLIVMEYVKGKTLRDITKDEGAIDENRALKIMEEVLSGLNYAHKKGIIHRDIKPVNIMITDYDYVKIMDFGIAKLLSDSQVTFTKGIIGTPHYMSPEQIRSPKSVTIQTDLYSLGITFYEILTGKLPFNIETDSEFELWSEIIKCEIPDLTEINSSISRNTANIVKKLTEKDLSNRYRNCDECLQDIRNKTSVNITSEKADDTVNSEKTIIKGFQPKAPETVFDKKEKDHENKEIITEKTIESKLSGKKEEKFTPAEETILEGSQPKDAKTVIYKKEKDPEYNVQKIINEKTIESKLPDKKEEEFTPADKTILEKSAKKAEDLKSSKIIESKERIETEAVQESVIEKKPPEDEKIKPGSSKRKYVYIAGAVIAAVISIFILNAVFNKNTKEPDKTIQSNVNQDKSLVDFETLKNRINDYLSKAYAKTELSSTQDSKMELSVNYKLNTANDIENQNNYNPFSNEYKKDAEFILNFKGIDSLVYNPAASSKYTGIYKIENSDMEITAQIEGETNPDKITKINNIDYNKKVDLKQETEQINTGDKKNIKTIKKTTPKKDFVPPPTKKIEPKKDPSIRPPK